MPYIQLKLEYDPDKDDANRDKHGVSLGFALEVLADPGRVDVLDTRFDYGEERFVTYGFAEGRVWVCVHASRSGAARIISVRKANERETQRYEGENRP
ncbi:BrnT family toxin [Hyphomonadaceae bacterium BL14]|nr:BrnT family toxin [Hyphomonadaceae bacterium BL14]